jgi:hypothetical protein
VPTDLVSVPGVRCARRGKQVQSVEASPGVRWRAPLAAAAMATAGASQCQPKRLIA